MDEFDLDLEAIEREMDSGEAPKVVLGVLSVRSPGAEWRDEVERGNVLVLNVNGDLAELAGDLARDVRDAGGSLVHFREFLIVTPPGIDVDTDNL